TREAAVGLEKEAMKDAIRKRLGIPIPPKPKTDTASPPPPAPKGAKLLRMLGSNTLKLRYESGDTVIYRKHWVVLLLEAWMPVLAILAVLVLFFQRLYQLARNPDEAFILFNGGVQMDGWAGALLILLLVLFGWF